MTQELYWWVQTIYAVVGIFVFILLGVALYGMYKRLVKLETALERMIEKGNDAAESARHIMANGEKLIVFWIYRLLKSIRRINDDC